MDNSEILAVFSEIIIFAKLHGLHTEITCQIRRCVTSSGKVNPYPQVRLLEDKV